MIDMNDLKEGEKYVAYTATGIWPKTSRPLNDYFNQNYMQYLIELFDGKKTFIVGGLMIVLGILTGNNQMILEGAGFITLRMAKK